MSIGLYALSVANSNDLIKIEKDCEITINIGIINIISGLYTVEKLNKLIKPLVISIVDKKIKIESPLYYKLDENLKKYLGFNDIYYFSMTSEKRIIYYPTSDEYYINIEYECEFKVEKESHKIPIGVYSINEIQNLLNLDKNVVNTKITINNKYLMISTNYEYVFDSHLTDCLGIPVFNNSSNYKIEQPFKYSKTGTLIPKFYTQGFLKNVNGDIITLKGSTLIEKRNYTIDQLNKILPSSVKIEQTNNYITIKSSDYYLLDENLISSLGLGKKYTHKHYGSDIITGNYFEDKFTEVHCNIIEKSISNHKTKEYLHSNGDILCVIKCDKSGQYIANDIKFIPLNMNITDFNRIEVSLADQDGTKIICNDFITYLLLKT